MIENFSANAAETMILAFLAITFLQSGVDKISDWKGNISWLNGHFSKTFLKNIVSPMLSIVLILEVIAGAFCVIGAIQLMLQGTSNFFAFWGIVLSCKVLLMFLFGQRVAKDYAGAFTIVGYFIVAAFGLYLLQYH